MDYEEKYKTALERARTWQNHLYDVNDKDYADELNFIFPELVESEDEKIVSTIRKALESKVEDLGNGVTRTECLAWLEKQGEQKSTCLLDNSESNVKFPFKARVKSNGKIVTIQGGQLSMDCKKYGKYVSNAENGYMVYKPEDLELVCNIEQKPADKIEPIRDFNSVFSREQIEEIDKRIEESQRLYNAKLRDAMRKVEDFPMTD